MSDCAEKGKAIRVYSPPLSDRGELLTIDIEGERVFPEKPVSEAKPGYGDPDGEDVSYVQLKEGTSMGGSTGSGVGKIRQRFREGKHSLGELKWSSYLDSESCWTGGGQGATQNASKSGCSASKAA